MLGVLRVQPTKPAPSGLAWPVDGPECPRGSVLLVSGEDDPGDTIRPRLDAAGADASRVRILKAVRVPGEASRMLSLQYDLEALALYLEEHPDVRLITIDPLTAYLGSTDSHKNSDVRARLQPLGDLAAHYGVAIVAVSHLNKNGEGGSALYRVSGSLAFVAAARASFVVTKDKVNAERRLLLPSKNNLGPDASGLACRIALADNGAPRVEWEKAAVVLSADDALSIATEDEGYIDTADWLRQLLAAGPMPVRQVQTEAKHIGVPWRTVQRALKKSGAESVREGFGPNARYVWRLKRRSGAAGAPSVPAPGDGAYEAHGDGAESSFPD